MALLGRFPVTTKPEDVDSHWKTHLDSAYVTLSLSTLLAFGHPTFPGHLIVIVPSQTTVSCALEVMFRLQLAAGHGGWVLVNANAHGTFAGLLMDRHEDIEPTVLHFTTLLIDFQWTACGRYRFL